MATKNILDTQFLRWTFLLAASLLALPSQSLAQNDNAPAPAPAAAPQPAAQSSAPPAAQPASPQQPAPDPLSNVVIKKESKLVLVDVVATDKKGNYLHDLTQNDFKVYEDNKEQTISSFSAGADTAIQANGQRRYLILFFDNSTMQTPDQIQARNAANKFIAANAGADHLMAVVDFGGSLRIVQNFTANADLLRAAVAGVKTSAVNPNANIAGDSQPVTMASTGISSLNNAEADFGARSMLLAVRSLAKNLRGTPGRKMVVLFSGGFALTPENESELTATIDACNKSNMAIYALDARGLVTGGPAASSRLRLQDDSNAAANHRQPQLRRPPTARTWSWFPIQIRSGPAAVVPAEPEVLAVPEDVVAQAELEEPAELAEDVAAPVEPEARALAAKAVLAELEPEAKPAEAPWRYHGR